jgi:hypothetical protein
MVHLCLSLPGLCWNRWCEDSLPSPSPISIPLGLGLTGVGLVGEGQVSGTPH